MSSCKLSIILILGLSLGACAKPSNPVEECHDYLSPYQVEFPDMSIRKAKVAACGTSLKATDLTPGITDSFEADQLTVLIYDKQTKTSYMGLFNGE